MDRAMAYEVARNFIRRETRAPSERTHGRDQYADMLSALCARAVAHTLERGEGEGALQVRLRKCGEILGLL